MSTNEEIREPRRVTLSAYASSQCAGSLTGTPSYQEDTNSTSGRSGGLFRRFILSRPLRSRSLTRNPSTAGVASGSDTASLAPSPDRFVPLSALVSAGAPATSSRQDLRPSALSLAGSAGDGSLSVAFTPGDGRNTARSPANKTGGCQKNRSSKPVDSFSALRSASSSRS